jgi:hypothetical protein
VADMKGRRLNLTTGRDLEPTLQVIRYYYIQNDVQRKPKIF